MPKNPLSAILDDPLAVGAADLFTRGKDYVKSGKGFRDSAALAVRVAPDLLTGGPPKALGRALTPVAQSMAQGFKENPARAAADFLPVVGTALGVADVATLRRKALEARARGDMETFRRLSAAAAAAAGTAATAMLPIPGAKGAAKGVVKATERAAEKGAAREAGRLAEKYGLEPSSERLSLWHGTNKPFDAFDWKFISTGEGGQSRGPGFYFNDVAPGKGSPAQGGRTVAEEYADKISKLRGGEPYVYNVSVPSGAMLDYSKPLAQQSPEVISALTDLLGERWISSRPDANMNSVLFAVEDWTHNGRRLEDRMADKGKSKGQIVAEALRNRGVIGTVHSDAPSRIFGGSDYAIFDPADMQIVERRSLAEKYGLEPK